MTSKTSAQNRLAQVKHLIVGKKQDAKSIPWDPDNTSFPSRREIVAAAGQPNGAVWVWGSDDFCGRLNLLTPTRIKAAAAEIRTGETAALDLPSHIPETPAFGRETFQHEIKALVEGKVETINNHRKKLQLIVRPGLRRHLPPEHTIRHTMGRIPPCRAPTDHDVLQQHPVQRLCPHG